MKERYKSFDTHFMKALDPAFDEKISPESHVSMGALKEGLNAKVNLRST